eukprot:6175869-Pleurochrysis_carterae.AAC.9
MSRFDWKDSPAIVARLAYGMQRTDAFDLPQLLNEGVCVLRLVNLLCSGVSLARDEAHEQTRLALGDGRTVARTPADANLCSRELYAVNDRLHDITLRESECMRMFALAERSVWLDGCVACEVGGHVRAHSRAAVRLRERRTCREAKLVYALLTLLSALRAKKRRLHVSGCDGVQLGLGK